MDFNDLPDDSSLLIAIQKQLRGMDFPVESSMKLSPNDIAKVQNMCTYYSKMYLDAFVATEQCHSLEVLVNPGATSIGFLEP